MKYAGWIRLVTATVLLLVCGVRVLASRSVQPASGHSDEAVCLRNTLKQASSADRQTLGDLYLALAKAIETGKVVRNTEQLAMGTANAIDLAFDGRHLIPGVDVGAQVDAVVAAAMGGANAVTITDANRDVIIAGLREVAWACGDAP